MPPIDSGKENQKVSAVISWRDKKAALKSLLKHLEGKHESALGPKFLKEFCTQVLNDPDYRMTVDTIGQLFGATVKTKKKEKARNVINAAHTCLDNFYSSSETYGRLQIRVSKPQSFGPNPSFYTIEYSHDSRPAPGDRPKVLSTNPVLSMWHLMIHAMPVTQIYVVYDTPNVWSIDTEADKQGWWAGSGEVKAAFELGQLLAQLPKRVPAAIKRWRDMGDFVAARNQCIIILGTAVGSETFDHVRQRDEWTKQQRFHFVEPPKDRPGRGHIRRGSSDTSLGKPFFYQEDPERDYALISYFRDEDNSGTLLGLQGISTIGTLAAARFMMSRSGVEQIRKKLGLNPKCGPEDQWPSFELLLTVPVLRDRLPGNAKIKILARH